MRSLEKSNKHFQKAVTRLPLGVSSNFRYWGDDKTIYIKRAKGARLWDIDDNEYVDYRLGYGPAILGYADERVDAAARDGIEVGGRSVDELLATLLPRLGPPVCLCFRHCHAMLLQTPNLPEIPKFGYFGAAYCHKMNDCSFIFLDLGPPSMRS